MALPILDGNQSATTLSSILTSGEHIPAHTVVSLGTQAITDISGAVSGSVVSISNFPATQTIAGTVTANLSTAVSPSIGSTYGDGDRYPVGTTIIPVGGWTAEIDGAHWQALTLTESGELATVASLQPSVHRIGVVTIGAGTVTIGAGTAQIGSVTASNLTSALAVYEGGNSDISVNIKSVGGQSFDQGQTWVPVAISEGSLPAGTNRIGVVTIGAGTVTLGAGTAQIGSVTASISNSVTIASFATSVTARLINPAGTSVTYAEVGTAGSPSIDVLSVQGVSGGTSLLIGGTTGSFTTRFGSVTTANTAQISTAVTNLSRKYLFVQNVTTSSNVITVGIGFTPTTTQGIQLAAGALIDFESSFIPTGAVYILSSVTGSPFTILEA